MWKTEKLGSIATVIAGQSPKGQHYNKEGRGTPFYQGKKDYGEKYLKQPTVWTDVVTKLAEKDDILMSVRAPVGALNIAPQQICIGRGLAAIRPSDEILHDYLFYALLQISPQLEGSAGAIFNSINKKQIEAIDVYLPPIAEQQRIVAKLDAVFAEIDRAVDVASSKLLDVGKLAKATVSTVFEELATGNQTTLGEYYDVRDGTHDSPKYVSEGYPLVTSKNLKTGSLDLSNAKCISEADYIAINKRSAVHAGDVLMAMIGTIGNPIVVTEEPRFSIKNVALFKTGANQNPWYLKYFLELPGTIKKMQQDAKGTTQKFVGLGYLRKFPFCAPPLATQDKAVERIDTLLNEIATHEKMIKAYIENYVALKLAILAQELQPPQSDAA